MGNCSGKKEPWGTKIFQRRSVEADITSDNEYASLPFVSLQTNSRLPQVKQQSTRRR